MTGFVAAFPGEVSGACTQYSLLFENMKIYPHFLMHIYMHTRIFFLAKVNPTLFLQVGPYPLSSVLQHPMSPCLQYFFSFRLMAALTTIRVSDMGSVLEQYYRFNASTLVSFIYIQQKQLSQRGSHWDVLLN